MARQRSIYAVIAYDGTEYCGFQYQPNVPTIQGTLESALDQFAEATKRIVGSGRTDTGVHAAAQVVAVDLFWQQSLTDLHRAWNAHLPPSISIHRMGEAPEGFHPRFSATSRTYRYRIYHFEDESRQALVRRSPLTDRTALFVSGALDLVAMQEAAQEFVGERDFGTFGQPTQGDSTVRRVTAASWQIVLANRLDRQRFPGRLLEFTISANAYLRRMVRNIVGTLLKVGMGQWSVVDVVRAFERIDRRLSAPPAPAHGLTLERVDYPVELGICS